MYVQMPNVFTVEGKERLTGEEIYLFYYICLCELRWYKNRIIISIDTIAYNLSLLKNESQNKDRIYSVLLSLRKKLAIIFDDIEIGGNKKFKYNIPLVIHKQDDSYYFGRSDSYRNGYEQISIDIFNRMNIVPIVNRGVYFLICCYILKVKKNVSYEEWSRILGYDEKQVKNIIYDMDDLGLINRQSGRYYLDDGVTRQEINSYTIPDVLTGETIVKLNKPKLKDTDTIYSLTYENITVKSLKELAKDSAWGKDNEDSFYYGSKKELKFDDYEIYKLCKEHGVDKVFIKKCERIMNAIKKKDDYDSLFEKFEEDYQADLNSNIEAAT